MCDHGSGVALFNSSEREKETDRRGNTHHNITPTQEQQQRVIENCKKTTKNRVEKTTFFRFFSVLLSFLFRLKEREREKGKKEERDKREKGRREWKKKTERGREKRVFTEIQNELEMRINRSEKKKEKKKEEKKKKIHFWFIELFFCFFFFFLFLIFFFLFKILLFSLLSLLF